MSLIVKVDNVIGIQFFFFFKKNYLFVCFNEMNINVDRDEKKKEEI